jgi:hypothetical protein
MRYIATVLILISGASGIGAACASGLDSSPAAHASLTIHSGHQPQKDPFMKGNRSGHAA